MPSSRSHIAIFGAGIAGLSAAQALARRGYKVSVYETLPEAGGFFRSSRRRDEGNMPSEYSWHGMGPWYHNAFDLLRQIPFDESGSIYDRALSRPIDFGILPDRGRAQFFDHSLRQLPRMFQLNLKEFVKAGWLMLKTWTANERSEKHYARQNAAAEWRHCLGTTGYLTWRSCFGPWIGSDWRNVSLHTAGRFFQKQLNTKPVHFHPADSEGGPWTHGAGDGWLLLKGPSSEVWFKKWVTHLSDLGVAFHWNSRLDRFNFDGQIIVAAELATEIVKADYYLLATNPFAAATIVARSGNLEQKEQLKLFHGLVQDGPHVQVSFRIGFSETICFPRARTAAVVADSEFNLTLFAQEQVWMHPHDIGAGIKSLWTGTSCVSSEPGRLFGLPVSRCTKEQFVAEVRAQVLGCGSLQALVREANGGRDLHQFPIVVLEVWNEWKFSPTGIHGPQPKWVNTVNTQAYLPQQSTPVPNLLLAGAHTRTQADVWSIEAAVESGRRAARAIDPRVEVIDQYQNPATQFVATLDDFCYRAGLPHVLDILMFLTLGGLTAVFTIVF